MNRVSNNNGDSMNRQQEFLMNSENFKRLENEIETLEARIIACREEIRLPRRLMATAQAFGSDEFIVKDLTFHIHNAHMSMVSDNDASIDLRSRYNILRLPNIHAIVVHWFPGDGPKFTLNFENAGHKCYAMSPDCAAYDDVVCHKIIAKKAVGDYERYEFGANIISVGGKSQS